MKKTILIILMVLMSLFTIYGASAATSDSVLNGWTLDDSGGFTSVVGVNALTNTGTGSVAGVSNQGRAFDGGGSDYLTAGAAMNGVKAFSVWFKPTNDIDATTSFNYLYQTGTSSNYMGLGTVSSGIADEVITFRVSGANDFYYWTESSTGTLSAGEWHLITITWDNANSNYRLYLNNTDIGLATKNNAPSEQTTYGAFVMGASSNSFDGDIDELYFYDTELSSGDVANIYTHLTYPFSTSGTNFTVTVTDSWDNSSLNNVSLVIDGVTYNNYTGNIVTTNILTNDSSTYNIFISAQDYFNYNATDVNVSESFQQQLNQSQIKFLGYDSVSNELIENINFTINGTKKLDNVTFSLKEYDGYLVEVDKDGFFDTSFYLNVSALDNYTYDFYGLYDAVFTVVPRDVLNNNTISGANITLSNSSYAYSGTFSGVENASFNITDGVYLLEIDAPDRVSYEGNVTVNGSEVFYAYMYAYNSLWVYAYSQETGNSIVSFNVSIQNNNYSYTNASSGGIAYFSDIVSGEYDVTVSATGYSSSTYSVTVTDNSFQTLNAFLSAATNTFIFTVKDKSSNSLIEGATITQKRFINGTLTTIESKDADITGRVQFTYTNGVEYTFVASEDGFETKTFVLEILFDNYNLLLTPVTVVNESVYFDDVSVSLVGSYFGNGTSWAAFEFDSPRGSLEDYWLTVSLDNGSSVTVSGSSATGSVLNASLLTLSPAFGDLALATLTYKSTLNAGNKTLSQVFVFTDWVARTGSLEALNDDLDNYSDFEKVVWSTIAIMLVMGIFGFIGLLVGETLVFGALGGVFGFVIAGLIGAIGWVTVGVVLFVLSIIIIGRVVSSG